MGTYAVTATGLSVSVTYDGNAALPVHAGNHAVAATVTQPGFSGGGLRRPAAGRERDP